MALINLVKFNGEANALAWKFPADNLSTNTQVIVNQSQEAILFKGGQGLDILAPGTHLLTTGNIPLLTRLINLPYGGQTPFTAEVWYVDKTVKRDLKWGTPAPIPVQDFDTRLPLHIRANGNWGIRIQDTRSFITQIVGTQGFVETSQIDRYFIGEIHQRLTSVLTKSLQRFSYTKVGMYLDKLSDAVRKKITDEFARFGIEVINFNVVSVNIPDDEQAKLMQMQSAGLEEAIRLRNLTDIDPNVLQRVGMLDIGKTAAANEGGGGAAGIMNTMMGAVMAMGPGMAMGQQMTQAMQPPTAPPAAPANNLAAKLTQLKQLFESDLISAEEFNAKKQEILNEL